ncbi:hypothetical protein PV703_24750 [Streptomyces sp. ME01-24h]|nr:hypothetical protein [Streptomyces sp. ME19-03-3]MDX3356459.1 hypothetical protein [Streptomyces sp. ME01-24h]
MKSVLWTVFAAVLSLITVAPVASIIGGHFVAGNPMGAAEIAMVGVVIGPMTVGLGFGARGAWRRALGRRPGPTQPHPGRKPSWIMLAVFLGFCSLGSLVKATTATEGSSAIVSIVIGGFLLWSAVASWNRSEGPRHSLAARAERGQWQTRERKQ